MSLFYEEYGPSTAPTIVFLHGGGVSGWMWRPQIDHFKEDYHCLVPDLPEQGKSTDGTPFSIQNSAEQIAELIKNHAHDGKAHVVGLSAGAQVVVALLHHTPECVDRAVISSALAKEMPGGKWMTPGVVALTYRWMIKPFKNNAWWIRINMKYSAGLSDEYYPDFSQSFKETTESGFTNLIVENQRFRLPKGLAQVEVPALVVYGKQEHKVIAESAQDIAAAMPNAKAYEAEHAGKLSIAEAHNWSLTTPELFNQTLQAWLNSDALPEALKEK